jgi:hypothetical protein
VHISAVVSRVALVVAIGALSACKDAEEPGVAFCTGFTNPTAVTRTCTNCTFSTATENEADGDLDTNVSAVPAANSTTDTVKVRLGGDDLPSGTLAGIFVTESDAITTRTRTLRTYLDGTLQETKTGNQLSVRRSEDGTVAGGYVGMTTTMAFDAVEYEVKNDYTMGQTPVYYLYEICSDGGVD